MYKGLNQFNLDLRGGMKAGSSSSKLCTHNPIPKKVFTSCISNIIDNNNNPLKVGSSSL